MFKDQNGEYDGGKITVAVVVFIVGLIALGMWIFPTYVVWQQTLQGKAALQRQEYERKVKVVQSEADLAASKNYAEAEINRAGGAAKAAEIISGSLNKNQAYLTYLAIEAQKENAQGTNHTTIYIPVGDNGIPLVQTTNP